MGLFIGGALAGFVAGWIISFITLPTIARKLGGLPHPREVKRYIATAEAMKREMKRGRKAKHF